MQAIYRYRSNGFVGAGLLLLSIGIVVVASIVVKLLAHRPDTNGERLAIVDPAPSTPSVATAPPKAAHPAPVWADLDLNGRAQVKYPIAWRMTYEQTPAPYDTYGPFLRNCTNGYFFQNPSAPTTVVYIALIEPAPDGEFCFSHGDFRQRYDTRSVQVLNDTKQIDITDWKPLDQTASRRLLFQSVLAQLRGGEIVIALLHDPEEDTTAEATFDAILSGIDETNQ